MQCPKCRGVMRTYNRNGVHIEQCDQCRGVFLDYGELEALSRLESQWVQPAPPAHGPGHGPAYHQPHYGHHQQQGVFHMLFST